MKRHPFRRPIFLLGVLATVLLAAIALERSGPRAPVDRPALGVQAEDVLGIAVQQGTRQLRAVRVDGGWRVEKPLTAHADAGVFVADIVDAVVGIVPLDAFARPELDRRTIGLEPARARIELTVRGAATPVVLLLGDYVPTGGSVYAALESDPRVLQIGALIVSEIEKAFYRAARHEDS